jgi:hypothetical protein
MWDRDGWQSLCATHHGAKTASEDGGFGNKRPPGGGGSEDMQLQPPDHDVDLRAYGQQNECS